ncbi:MAG TPA: flagellar biosynthetic protein FliO [Burkholderiales bacterium]|nr:flagellar biosynthetic protein FliO [Burkholderiales bacterium]
MTPFRIPAQSALAAAATPAFATGGSDAGAVTSSLLQATLGLAVVLAVIWIIVWLLRRFTPLAKSGASPIKLVAHTPLGQRERVVVVEIADDWLVLGVAPGRINMLQVRPKSALPQPRQPDHPFAKLLATMKAPRRES